MKRLVRSIIFLVITVAVVYIINSIYTIRKVNYINDWGNSSTIANFYNEPKNSLDVLVFGTSTNGCGIQPAVIWQEQGITSYNLSTENQYSIVAYYLLMESLKYQRPDVVILNSRWITYQYEDSPYYSTYNKSMVHKVMDHMRLSEVKIQASLDIGSRTKTPSAIEYIFPLTLYHNREDLSENDFDFSRLSGQHPLKGSSIQLKTNYAYSDDRLMEPKETSGDYDFSAIGPKYTAKIIELCKANDIEVLLIYFPVGTWRWGSANWEDYMKVQKFAEIHGVRYLDMNLKEIKDSIHIDPVTDFEYEAHLNILGAYKASKYLASYLAENYSFEQNYTPAVTESFNKTAETYMAYYNEYKVTTDLFNATELENYLSVLNEQDDNIVIISAKDEFTYSLTESQKRGLKALGLQTGFSSDLFHNSYIAIIDSGQVVYEKYSPNKLEYTYKITEDIVFTVNSAGWDAGPVSSVILGDKDYSQNARGLNFVVFNKHLGLVIDSVNFDTYAGEKAIRKLRL